MSTFTFHNPSGSAYFVLEAIPRSTDLLYPTSSTQIYYISGSSFTEVTSSVTNPFVVNDFKWGAVIPPGTSSFVWGPRHLAIHLQEKKILTWSEQLPELGKEPGANRP